MIKNMSIFKKCFCCELTIGGSIIGWLEFLLNLFSIIIVGSVIETVEELKSTTYRNSITFHQFADSYLSKTNIGIYLGIKIICFISSIFLIAGSLSRRKLFLIPFLFSYGVYIAVYMIVIILHLFIINDLYKLAAVLIAIALFGVNVYFWLCVISLYQYLVHLEKARYREICFMRPLPSNSSHVSSQRSIQSQMTNRPNFV